MPQPSSAAVLSSAAALPVTDVLTPTRDIRADLAPDLLALLIGAKPHPDLAAWERPGTVADLAAAARLAAAESGAPVTLTSADGRVAVAGAPGLAPGQVRLVASGARRRDDA